MSHPSSPRIRLVVPTLGERSTYLAETLRSIHNQGVPCDLVIVSPDSAPEARAQAADAGARWVSDPGSLPGAINAGIGAVDPLGLPHSKIDYVTWLGDDDLLTPGSLTRTVEALDADPGAVLAFGECQYIDAAGHPLWISRAGPWATRVLSWGPQLIPQPGMLVRRTAWDAVGGLDEGLRFAFDFDLLLKLQSEGTFISIPHMVSRFRWHPASLTVSDRTTNLVESQEVKRRYLTPRQNRWKWVWERPVRIATRTAAREVERRARRIQTQVSGA